MMGHPSIADTASTDRVNALLAIIGNPQAAADALAKIAQAQKAADDAQASAKAAGADLDVKRDEIAQREKAAEAKLAEATRIRDEAQTLQSDAAKRLARLQAIGRSLETLGTP